MRDCTTKTTFARLLLAAPLLFGLPACDDDDSTSSEADGGAADGGKKDSGSDIDDGGLVADLDADIDGGTPVEEMDGGDPGTDAGTEVDAGTPVTVAGDTYALTSAGRLLSLLRVSGQVVAQAQLTGIPAGEALLGLDVRPKDGALYVLTAAGKLYTVDPATGAASAAIVLKNDASDASDPFAALSGTTFGVDFNPVADRLRVVTDMGQNLRINVDTGATITDLAINPSSAKLSAAAYTNSFGAACRTQLYVVDGTAGTLSLQNPPNDGILVAVGSLGSLAAPVVAFDIATAEDGSNAALLVVSNATSTSILDVSLSSGAASGARAVTLASGETLLGVALKTPVNAPSQALGELLGLTEENALVSFNRGAPGKLCTQNAITGLATGEQALGIDVRPSDGALYALGSSGKLYTVNTGTGVATLKSTLLAAASDLSDPFVSLPADAYAIGFNPVPDRLRVITRTGKNLRIDVTTGAVTTDVNLSPANADVTGLGYLNSVAGATSTALYALDTGTKSLVRVGSVPATGGACDGASPDSGNPNCGVVTSIGSLGLSGDVSAINGFDIDGTNGVALAALSLGDAASSTLYAVNLTTGVAALPAGTANGTIGGGKRLRGLVFTANP